MVFKGLNFSVSRSGWTPDALKSGMQKYVRRGNWQKAARCVWEMLEFTVQATSPQEQKTAKALRTNILHRVMICAGEDIGAADPMHMAFAMRTIRGLMANPPADSRTEFSEVVSALKALAEARKVRNVSFLKNLLVRVPSEFPTLSHLRKDSILAVGLTAEEGEALRWLLSLATTAPYAPAKGVSGPEGETRLDEAITTILRRAGKGLSAETMQGAASVSAHLLARRWAVIPAALQFLAEQAAAEGRRRTRVVHLFWELLCTGAAMAVSEVVRPLATQVLTTLQAAYGQTREQDIYVITALELLLEYGVAEWREAMAALQLFIPPTAEEVTDILTTCLSGARLELDRCVLDMHTRAGRAAGRSALDFALEGSVVVPERTALELPLAKALYVAVKLFQEMRRGAVGWSEVAAGVQTAGSLSGEEQRQVLALVRLLGNSTTLCAAASAPGRPGRSAEACASSGSARTAVRHPQEPPHPAVAQAYEVVAELRSAEFEVLATMVGCQGGRKPALRQVRMLADGHIWLLKPVKDGFYAFVDGQKARYGLERIGMDIVCVDGVLHVRMRWVERAENLSRLSRRRKEVWYTCEAVRRPFLRIVMFRIGLHVSDTNTFNILAIRGTDVPYNLLSIDEMTSIATHRGPHVFGGLKAEAVMRTEDEAWAREVLREWEEQVGEPLDYAYLKAVLQERLGWVF